MPNTMDNLRTQIKNLPDIEKLKLVDVILEELDRPNPELDQIWADEARQRWKVYKKGTLKTVDYEEVMQKHRHS